MADKIKTDEKADEVRRSADRIARQIIDLTRNGLFVTLRFMDVALCQFDYINSDRLTDNVTDVKTIATTGQHMIYDPQYIIEQYMKDRQKLSRDYLHIVLHCVFRHPFVSRSLNREYWDLACDIAVESIICELDVKQADTRDAAEINSEINRIRGMIKQMTAEHLYSWFMSGAAPQKDMEKWRKLFYHDDHRVWWEIAKQIEEEMKRRAEEEKEEYVQEDDYEQQSDTEESEEEASEDSEDDTEETDDAAESGDEENQEDTSGEESTEGEEGNTEDTGEDTEENEEEPEEASEEEWHEDEYEEEYSSTPGETMDRENPDDMADPDSDTQETGEDSDGSGSGGGGAGDDPEESEKEGSGKGEDSAEGMNGETGEEGKQDKPDSSMSGQTDEGRPDGEENSDDEQSGNSQDMSGSGGQQQKGSQGGQHSAGTGGGGDGSQSAWEHSSGESTRKSGADEDGERSQMKGSAGTEEVKSSDDGKKQEAQAEQGTAESGEEEKAPSYMHSGEEQKELEDKWKEISERILVDLETSSKEWGDKSDGMVQGIKKINRDKYDYATFLRKFSTLKEDIQINDDEFDYVYYTLGMERYGNIPLIEPLEYKEVRKVRDFVIAIDTSGSCAGEVVQKFLDKTFSIFMQQENFFRKINLHIIQCDAEIQEVAKITDKTEFEDYMRNLEFKGFGGTDFRPVFEYVDRMIEAKEFEDLKGLIYFTDGNGTYPKRRPPYETAFIFVDDDEFEYQVPSWAMKLVLETGDITEEVLI
jgi:predicted metal-dependent peptidase